MLITISRTLKMELINDHQVMTGTIILAAIFLIIAA